MFECTEHIKEMAKESYGQRNLAFSHRKKIRS